MTKEELAMIGAIEKASCGVQKINAGTVRSWLRTSSLDVLGAAVQLVVRNSRNVEPPLSMEEICTTVEAYYQRCLVENRQASNYAPNRSIAGLEFVGWFRSLWLDTRVPREYLIRLKMMLRNICVTYKVPPEEIVGAVIEHLFETPEIAEFFSDWKSDPLLARVFALAMEWQGRSPHGEH